MIIYLRKLYDTFAPADQQSADKIEKLKMNQLVKCEITQPRNLAFHRKYFALLNLGFDAFNPNSMKYKGLEVAKNFDAFREDTLIQAGFFTATFNIDGSCKPKAKSISFANMNDEEFENMYNETINILLEKVLVNYTRDDLDAVVDKLLRFG